MEARTPGGSNWKLIWGLRCLALDLPPTGHWFLTMKKKTKIKHCLQQAILEEQRLKKLQYLLSCFLSFILSCLERGRQLFTHIQKFPTIWTRSTCLVEMTGFPTSLSSSASFSVPCGPVVLKDNWMVSHWAPFLLSLLLTPKTMEDQLS